MTKAPIDPRRRFLIAGGTGAAAAFALTGKVDAWSCETNKDSAAPISKMVADAMRTGHYVAGIGDSYWAHPQDGVFLPGGVYEAADIELIGNKSPFPALVLWAIPGTVVIRIPSDRYLFQTSQRMSRIWVFGITFAGGKGVLNHSFTGTNVDGIFSFERCVFDNYNECAIANSARDQPYLRVRDCTFMAAKGASTIGIAWGGFADGTIIEGNAFLRNRYHLKLGPSFGGSVHVLRNDFLRWDTESPFISAIWLVPQSQPNTFGANSGWGTQIVGNKFGNENMEAEDVRILIANEREGETRATRAHSEHFSTGGRDGGYLGGVTIRDCLVACNAATRSPFMRSWIAEVRNFAYADNRHIGGGHTYLCEFMGPRGGDYTNLNWTVTLDPAGNELQGSPFAVGVSNAPVGPIHDPAGVLGTVEEAILASTGGDEASFVLLGAAEWPEAFSTYMGTRVVPDLDHAGHARAALVHVPGPNVGVSVALNGVIGGRLSWATLELKRAAQRSVTSVRVHIRDVRINKDARIVRYVLPPEWRRIRIPFTMPADADAGAWQLVIAADDWQNDGADSFCVAHAFVHHGREPMRDGHLRTLGDGKWNGPHLIMGTTHIWEHEGRLRLKSGAPPSSENDGMPV